jgi:hypothetical protein
MRESACHWNGAIAQGPIMFKSKEYGRDFALPEKGRTLPKKGV